MSCAFTPEVHLLVNPDDEYLFDPIPLDATPQHGVLVCIFWPFDMVDAAVVFGAVDDVLAG